MKKLILFLFIGLFAIPAIAADFKSGDELVAAMHKKYDGKWYKTLTFVQKTINYKPDGTEEADIWYEAFSGPGKLRIDFDPVSGGNGILFADATLYSLKDGKVAGKRPFVHPLLVLGFDVYVQDVAKTIEQIKGLKIDLSVIHQEIWQGKAVYVVGAKEGDLKTPQFWVDKRNLLFVRMLDLTGKDRKSVAETQFNKYVKVKGGGRVAAEVKFFVDGKPRTTEVYSDIQTGKPLNADLWDPEKWNSVDKTYFKLK